MLILFLIWDETGKTHYFSQEISKDSATRVSSRWMNLIGEPEALWKEASLGRKRVRGQRKQ